MASQERYLQFARAVKLLEILENSRFGRTVEELRDEVVEALGLDSVSTKSIDRDLKFWQRCGYPLDTEKIGEPTKRTVWKLDRHYLRQPVPKLPVTVPELLAFSAALELLTPLAGTPYWSAIQSLWDKVRAELPAKVWEQFAKERPALLVRGQPAKQYDGKEGILSSLNRAIFEHRVCEIRYQSLKQEQPKQRAIQPRALVMFEGSLYVVASDHEGPSGGSERHKLFKLDRVSAVTVLDKRFKPADVDAEELFGSSIGIWRNEQPERFVIRVDAYAARWLRETPFHPNQLVHELEGGGLEIEIDSGFREELLPRVLNLGDHAELIEPVAAREELARIVGELANRYGSA